MNPHSAEIDRKIDQMRKLGKYRNVNIVNTSHEDFIRVYSSSVFTNLINTTFSKTYVRKFPCADCGGKSTDRCHGIGDERPVLLLRALERVYPDISVPTSLELIVFEFLELHKPTKFALKCNPCHKAEGKNLRCGVSEEMAEKIMTPQDPRILK